MSAIGRAAAVLAVVGAVAVVGYLLFTGGGGNAYAVKATFLNASQLVNGNLVQIGGTQAGEVTDIKITPNGQAEVTMSISETYKPLRKGTRAIVRQASLSGIANRYIDLQMPETTSRTVGEEGEIPDGGSIGAEETTSAVDLDQLFNTLDPKTRTALTAFFVNSQRQYAGVGKEANRGWQYLNPALSTSRRLFNELSQDTPLLEAFLVDSARLVTAVAERGDDLTNAVTNLNTTTRSLANEKVALRESLRRFPGFMRTANTTFVNLRTTLDDVDPLVEESKKVAPKLRPFFAELRPFAREIRPTISDLRTIIRSPGPDNDLFELNDTFPPLAKVALDEAERNGEVRRGAYPEMIEALNDSAEPFAEFRPYTKDLMGWFDDFSHSGNYDANGGFSRAQVYFDATVVADQIREEIINQLGSSCPPAPGVFCFIATQLLNGIIAGLPDETNRRVGQHKRCPGGSEDDTRDGSNKFSEEERDELGCREEDRSVGN